MQRLKEANVEKRVDGFILKAGQSAMQRLQRQSHGEKDIFKNKNSGHTRETDNVKTNHTISSTQSLLGSTTVDVVEHPEKSEMLFSWFGGQKSAKHCCAVSALS